MIASVSDAILAFRVLGAVAFLTSAVVAAMLWWRVRWLPNSLWFAVTSVLSFAGAAALTKLSQTTAVNQSVVLVANIAVAGAVFGWAVVGYLIHRQRPRS